jgi:hypothetical protein
MSMRILNNGEQLYDIRTKINENFSEVSSLYTIVQSLTSFCAERGWRAPWIVTPTPTAILPTPTATPIVGPTPTPVAPTSTPIVPTLTPTPPSIEYSSYFTATLADGEPVDQSYLDLTYAGLISGDKFYYEPANMVTLTGAPVLRQLIIHVDTEPRAVVQFDNGRIGLTYGYVTNIYPDTDLEFEGFLFNGDVYYETGTYEAVSAIEV